MNNLELLELAAKAAGIKIHKRFPSGMPKTWNPLENDGDALRLAVVLCIDIHTCQNAEPPETRCATIRRAIVRAAAEIGKSK